MTNKEYYKEQILDIACEGSYIAINKDTQMICKCGELNCRECLFGSSNNLNCTQEFIEWCKAEHAEPCPFEKGELVEVSDNDRDWRLRYFECKRNGYYLCSNANENLYPWKYCRKYGTLGNSMSKENV